MVAAPHRRSLHSVFVIVIGACASSPPICEQANFDVCTSCTQDKDCDSGSERGEVCAPDMQCWPPGVLHTLTVTWTIGGQPANATTCAKLAGELVVSFDNTGLMPDEIVTSPVPCTAGMVVQDEAPPNLRNVTILAGRHALGNTVAVGQMVTIDLPTSLPPF